MRFSWTYRADPESALIQASDGTFCGTTFAAASGPIYGAVNRISPSGTESLVHSSSDGTSNADVVFKVTP